jgi:hypothetical protein
LSFTKLDLEANKHLLRELYGGEHHDFDYVFNSRERSINLNKVEVLKTNPDKRSASHNFCANFLFGKVWYSSNGNKYYEQVRRNDKIIGLYCANTPEELMLGVNIEHEK